MPQRAAVCKGDVCVFAHKNAKYMPRNVPPLGRAVRRFICPARAHVQKINKNQKK
jgi:hypothetical protein